MPHHTSTTCSALRAPFFHSLRVGALTGFMALAASGLTQPAAAATFTDITASAGIPTDRNVRGAGWGDYDNDDCQDLLLATAGGPFCSAIIVRAVSPM
jgi:hypothetical protein